MDIKIILVVKILLIRLMEYGIRENILKRVIKKTDLMELVLLVQKLKLNRYITTTFCNHLTIHMELQISYRLFLGIFDSSKSTAREEICATAFRNFVSETVMTFIA